MRIKPIGAAVYGVDLGKNTFHVVGTDLLGNTLQRITLSRSNIFTFFSNAPKAVIGMEACPGSQWLARHLATLGHAVRIIPAQFVKPYVKSNKNDLIDAAAIAEAVTRPSMRFVQVKSTEQVELQSMHRIRERLVRTRTQLINQIRGFCLEFGIPIRHGVGSFKAELPKILADEENDLTPCMRNMLSDVSAELAGLEDRIALMTRKIEAIAACSAIATQLTSIPGIGKLTATAIISAVGDGSQFSKARDLAAWFGLVPAQYSTGGKTTLRGISKRGNPYIRRLLIHGARSCMLHLDRVKDRLGPWISSMEARMHSNKVVVALANKLARMVWVILRRPGTLYLQFL